MNISKTVIRKIIMFTVGLLLGIILLIMIISMFAGKEEEEEKKISSVHIYNEEVTNHWTVANTIISISLFIIGMKMCTKFESYERCLYECNSNVKDIQKNAISINRYYVCCNKKEELVETNNDKEVIVDKEVVNDKKEVIVDKEVVNDKKEVIVEKEVVNDKKEVVNDKKEVIVEKEVVNDKKEVIENTPSIILYQKDELGLE